MKSFYSFLTFIFVVTACSQQPAVSDISIIPYPNHLTREEGSFELQPSTQLVINDHGKFGDQVDFLQTLVKETLGSSLSSQKGNNTIEICQSDTFTVAESYLLNISSEKITLTAGHAAGMLYAIESLRQLLPSRSAPVSSVILPALTINDQPAYNWRGMHLDVSRHFFSMDYLKRYVDLLALYKLNKLHLHLTDDQGWRMEIKKYPELTQKGAWRTFNNQDSVCIKKAEQDSRFAFEPEHVVTRNGQTLYGGYYTQEQMKELVAYARQRNVEIIPEIDMPGHMMAAINAFPYLAAGGKSAWGKVFSTPLNPVDERTYTFVENIMDEVIQIFPSQYIHIGGDEVEKTSWEKSKACHRFMKQKGLETFQQLEGYFINRVAQYLQAKGKQVIVWDDALDGGIDSTLNVMYWRNWVGDVPTKTVANGNQLIMSPGDPFYFSRTNLKLFDVYNKKLLSSKFPADQKSKIKGLQACVWSETVPSEKIADALIFPRALALSERSWSNETVQNWSSFKLRLKKQLQLLDNLGVNYSYHPTTELLPFMEVDTTNHRIGILFESELTNPTIFYTTDGTMPTTSSNLYKGQFYISESASICAAVFKDGQLMEPVLKKQVDYHKAIGKPVTYYTPWNNAYPAGDAGALTDGYRGGNSYGDGKWQGFTNDIDVIIDLEKEEVLSSFSATFMQDIGPGVFMPEYVEVSVSADGKQFRKVLFIENDIPADQKGLVLKNFTGSLKAEKARYVKVVAHNPKHAFVFTDELVIK